jgi:hypothetical protein
MISGIKSRGNVKKDQDDFCAGQGHVECHSGGAEEQFQYYKMVGNLTLV